eukprot:9185981-Pyramimonas_sp.AAC.1
MTSQETKDISFSINKETLAFTIQSLVNITLKTWHRRNASFGATPTSADRDVALRNLQAKVYQAIYEEGNMCMPPDAKAGTLAEGDDAAETFDVFYFEQRLCSAAWHGHLDAPTA